MNIDWSQVGTIAGSLIGGGGLASFFAWLANRRKNAAAGRSVEIKGELQIVDSAVTLVQTLQKDMRRLSARIEQVENKNQRLERKIESLENENRSLEEQVRTLTVCNDELRERCEALESENRRLRPQGG